MSGTSQTASTSSAEGEVWRLGAVRLAAALAAGELAAEQVVGDLLARIEEVNPALNAVVHTAGDAVERARAVDAARARGERLPAFAGVPISVKSEIDVAGSPSTAGAACRRDRVPRADAPTVARLRKAGAIVLARTNQPDFGGRLHTDSGLYGATVNPWDPGVTPGGSSGGDAVALAAGMVPLGLGSDIGGSLRSPATCCGIVSLKPGHGRVPIASEDLPVPVSDQLMCVQGPMARDVADLRAALAVLAGADPRDPWAVPDPRPAERPGRPRVAVATLGAAAPVARAVRAAAGSLAAAGYEVVDLVPPALEEVFDTWLAIVSLGAPTGVETADVPGEGVVTFNRLVREARAAQRRPAGDHPLAAALARRHRLGGRWAEFFTGTHLILGPVWTTPPWPVGYDVSGPEQAFSVLTRAILTVAANGLGLPAVAVPAAVHDGLPIGVQLIGPRFAEERCLDAAERIQESLGTFTPITPA